MIKGLKEIQRKDPIIATYNADSLLKDPSGVHDNYSRHAVTHIPLGDTSTYLESLEKWIYVNKGCFIGAVVGSFGYGKSSTAVHLWNECNQQEILSIPPFSWRSLEEFVGGVYGWTRYCLEKVAPSLSNELAQIFERYHKMSIEQLSVQYQLSQETLKTMLDEGRLRLEFSPTDVLDFLKEVTDLILHAKFKGMVVFSDELQVTLEAYPSRNRFFDDIFGLVNEILTRHGNYGIIFVMPSDTDALMVNIRSDITERLEKCHLFLRLDALYDRGFAAHLWEKYASLFGFEVKKFEIVASAVLDSLGQISSRKDLGAGPRSVVETFVQIANYYEKHHKTYGITDLVDDYLSRKIAFDLGGKIVGSVSEALAIPIVKENTKRTELVKVLAAFPQGCPDSVIQQLGLSQTLDDAIRDLFLFPQIIARGPEGYTLTKLLEEQPRERKVYVEFLRDFVQRYTEDKLHAKMACAGFYNHIITHVFEKGRKDQLDRWSYEDSPSNAGPIVQELVGSVSEFNLQNVTYPYRNLRLEVSIDDMDTSVPSKEFAIYFFLDCKSSHDDVGSIKRLGRKSVMFNLNILRRVSEQLTIPYLSEMFPSEKMSPLFLLSAVTFIDQHKKQIPPSEIGEADLVCQRAVEAATEILLGQEVARNSEIPVQFLGLRLPREIFLKLCKEVYPQYETFITSSHWQEDIRRYEQALKDERVSLRKARGREEFSAHKDEIGNIFFGGQPAKLTVQTFAESLHNLLDTNWGGKGENSATIHFKLHPLELSIREWLEESLETKKRGQHTIKTLFYQDVFDKATDLGYLNDEVGVAIELLKLRQYISYDAKGKHLEQAIIAIDDTRESIYQQLTGLQKDVGLVKFIPEFKEEIYSEHFPELFAKLGQIKEIEECELVGERVRKLIKGFESWRITYTAQLQAQISEALQRADHIASEKLAAILESELKGTVAWVSDLNMCRMVMAEKYINIRNKLKNIVVEFQQLETGFSLTLDTQSFTEFYRRKEKSIDEFREQMTLLQAANIELTHYQKWTEILVLAGDVYEEAQKGAIAFNNPIFQDKLDKVFSSIHSEFTGRSVAALPDHEIFSKDISKIKDELEGWTRKQRQGFLELKERYEKDLDRIGVQEFKLRTGFDSFNPSGSFQDLYQEIKAKTTVYLQALGDELQQLQGDAFYISEIHSVDVGEIPQSLSEATNVLRELGAKLSTKVIESSEEWSSCIEIVEPIKELLRNTRTNLKGIAVPQEPSDKEKAILDLLSEPGGKDLSQVIMELFQQEGEKLKLPELLDSVQSLFKKLQITIKLYRKG